MKRAPKLERLVIPDASRTVKKWFLTRESAEAVVKEIKAHIAMTGESHTCPYHTHTRPPKSAHVEYLDEFTLPKRFRLKKRFCPCPVCWDEYPKFGKGKIAWFPDEGVIRLIGDECFATLNPEEHERAQAQFDIEIKRRRDTEFLLANLGHLPGVIAVAQRAKEVAVATDRFHGLLHDRLRSLNLNLWSYVHRDGKLPVTVTESEFRRGSDGEMYTKEIDVTKPYATLPGYKMLNPKELRMAASIDRCSSELKKYDFGKSWEIAVERMDDNERHSTATRVSRAVNALRGRIDALDEIRQFSKRVAINTLRSWGQQSGCAIPCEYEHDGTYIKMFRPDYGSVGFPVPEGIGKNIGTIDFWTDRKDRR